MKWVCALLVFAGLASSLLASQGVLQTVPPERFRAAGLHKLSAEELAALEALISEVRVRDTAPGGEVAKNPGWLRALITLQDVAARPDAVEALESQLAHDYDGWNGRTVFRLKNGQVWQQSDSSTRIDSSLTEPKVKIYPGMLGVYWLEIEGVKQRVKVKPVKLQ